MKLTVLGTGHGGATECYNTCFTIESKKKYFLVDAGRREWNYKTTKKSRNTY